VTILDMTYDDINHLVAKRFLILQIEGIMKTEFRLGVRTSTRPDFIEGVRAVLVDKDQVSARIIVLRSHFVMFINQNAVEPSMVN